MDRNETEQMVKDSKSSHLCLVLPTGYGKSKLGITACMKHNPAKILVVIPRLVLIDNWKREFIKWGYEEALTHVAFSTYVSLHKQVVNSHNVKHQWDVVIFDECHHLSERAVESVSEMNIKHAILLSATLGSQKRFTIRQLFPSVQFIYVRMKEAIENQVLPDPKVILVPLMLNNSVKNCIYEVRPKAKGPTYVMKNLTERFKVPKNAHAICYCTQQEYYDVLSKDIDTAKRRAMSIKALEKRWLFLCGQRLKWLSSIKTEIVKQIQEKYVSCRTLTFCSSIAQTEQLGENCINSKNKESLEVLESFNAGEIDHITSCNMLNEGMNLVNCQVGIYANLNSSETIIKQRLGRILRHPEPVVIIPYFKHTRDEELVTKMIEDYNKDLLTYKTIDSLLCK